MATEMPISELVAQFVAFTGVEDTSQAIQMLEATNNDIQAAVELYFAAQGGGAVQGVDTGPSSRERIEDEQHIRAPIPAKIERLVGTPGDDVHRRRQFRIPNSESHQPIMDAFRARREEGMAGNASEMRKVDAHWSDQFSPPTSLLFQEGGCEDAANFAQQSNKWLLVNIQSPSSFDSHRLNRDTWKDTAMEAMLPVSFVLYQTYDVSEEGQMLANSWGVTSFPVVIVVDPVTGVAMKKWHGFVRADALIEELVPFMDTGFDDPGASRLAASSFRKHKKHTVSTVSTVDEAQEEGMRPQVKHLESRVSQEQPTHTPTEIGTSEEPSTSLPVLDAEAIQNQAKLELPEEPTSDLEKPCRIAIRLPDGTRAKRKFPSSAPLGVLKTWCMSLSLEAAGGRAFVLAEAMPGAARIDLEAPEGKTVGDAGIAGVMLGMKWVETE